MFRIPYRSPGAKEMRGALVARERWIEERLKDPAVQREMDQALVEAKTVAAMLKERFGATRVRLHGSLARRDNPEGFDIDIAVEGIPSDRYFEAIGEAERLVSRKLDLIDVADATPLMKRRVEQDGIDLP